MKKRSGTLLSSEVSGSPGARARLVGFVRATWPLMLICAAAGYLLRAAWPVPAMNQTQIGFLLLLLCGVLAACMARSEASLAAYIKGAQGEELTARELMRLPGGYRVFHGVRARRGRRGAGDYDHVVVGPAGVFVIETKNWSGAITVEAGRILCNQEPPSRPPLEQVKARAADLRERILRERQLDLEIHPILCFAGGELAGGTQGVGGVVVCAVRGLCDALTDSTEAPLPDANGLAVAALLEKGLEE